MYTVCVIVCDDEQCQDGVGSGVNLNVIHKEEVIHDDSPVGCLFLVTPNQLHLSWSSFSLNISVHWLSVTRFWSEDVVVSFIYVSPPSTTGSMTSVGFVVSLNPSPGNSKMPS